MEYNNCTIINLQLSSNLFNNLYKIICVSFLVDIGVGQSDKLFSVFASFSQYNAFMEIIHWIIQNLVELCTHIQYMYIVPEFCKIMLGKTLLKKIGKVCFSSCPHFLLIHVHTYSKRNNLEKGVSTSALSPKAFIVLIVSLSYHRRVLCSFKVSIFYHDALWNNKEKRNFSSSPFVKSHTFDSSSICFTVPVDWPLVNNCRCSLFVQSCGNPILAIESEPLHISLTSYSLKKISFNNIV